MNAFPFLRRFLRPLAPPLLAVFVLAGCASFSDDGGFNTVNQAAQQRLNKETSWTRSEQDADNVARRVRAMLARPLAVDDAVQIALINNRELQASYSELGIAEADLVQAGRLPNPGFSFGRTHSGGDIKIERSLSLSVMRLLTMPAASRIEARRFEQTKLKVADAMLRTAAQTRKAYFQSIAATQSLQYLEQVKQAAEVAHELAVRMAKKGNFSQLDAAREQAFYLDTSAQLTRARTQAVQERENLIRLLGLRRQDGELQLPQRLPDLPKQPVTLADSEQVAMEQRLDVQSAKLEVAALQTSLGLSKATRFVNVLDLGYVRNSETGKAAEVGYQAGIEIPLFDWGGARVAKAEAIYMQAAHRLAATAVQAQSEVRVAYAAQQNAYALARQYRDDVVPLRKRISDEYLLRYNGMLASVFELLADAREQANAVNAAIDASRDYWIADSDLQLALGGRSAPAPNNIEGNRHD
ncbi:MULTISPECIES: TolC family protein [unclassified Herbaspirillum]|uniref:TolC family protein n=1 Tax=unclassified Herbaspirillum TaxID=2624150 RepID=UPI000E2EB722|nr:MULTISPECIES: TolC family protein [unclassified Herbaspirillum]RFB73655.1 TolC family protein [Herbaspirillum sp. 3R-3a1]TFI10542.1 TolC family protein [Herbaspirillum sp. 3R11]TFI16447.1 TolC family protein [Herbaspirillum sp. 3R-11]TFI21394.1 TolC family protein [Herbaspirillum sp. 3C11]